MKTQYDYSKIDAAILAALKDGPKKFDGIQRGDVQIEAKKLETDDKAKRGTWSGTGAFRFIDRRVQALRKSGQIAYNTKTGWALTAAPVGKK